MAPEPFILWLLAGLTAGLIGSILLGGNSVWKYLAAGVAGAVLISYGIAFFGINVPISGWLIRQLTVATAGAVFLIIVVRVME